ncbi:hypothetical protein N8T08_001804 [Aspergillus melleus]|uniref:Uncharacterized protein n=1 Tax=Aspergillus melleus TaxID=138277 RepID=A0ACC3B8W5_9EURO|nr:hypothetical protein N8T08_001804 [Aspergillus melleus]
MVRVVQPVLVLTSCVLNVGALVCLVVVGIACTKRGSHDLQTLAFFQVSLLHLDVYLDTEHGLINVIKVNTRTLATGDSRTSEAIWTAFSTARHEGRLPDSYSIGILGYCAGEAHNTTLACTHPRPGFWFDISEIAGAGNQMTGYRLSSLRGSLGTYKNSSQWMQILYFLATGLTAVQLLGALVPTMTRGVGGGLTVLLSGVACFFSLATATLATINFAFLKGIFATELESHGLTGTLGTSAFVTLWLGIILSFGAFVDWTLIACCCFNRDRRRTLGNLPLR